MYFISDTGTPSVREILKLVNGSLDASLSVVPKIYVSLLLNFNKYEGEFNLISVFHHTNVEANTSELIQKLSTQGVSSICL